MNKSKLFLVSPAFNESESLTVFVDALRSTIGDLDAHLILVDDGSTDNTFDLITKLKTTNNEPGKFEITGIRLSRNFGQQAAIFAGLEAAFAMGSTEDYFIILDCDLEHPPRYIKVIVENLEKGIPHVQMVRRENIQNLSLFKRHTSAFFYRLFSKLSGLKMHPGSSDFRGFNYRFLKAFLKLRESSRFNRGIAYWVGFSRLEVPYELGSRHAGKTKFSIVKMLRLSFTAITQFSSKPLIIMISTFVAISFTVCFIYIVAELHRYFAGLPFQDGWASIMFFIAFWSGTILLSQLFLSIYISRIFEEVKNRPAYIIDETTN